MQLSNGCCLQESLPRWIILIVCSVFFIYIPNCNIFLLNLYCCSLQKYYICNLSKMAIIDRILFQQLFFASIQGVSIPQTPPPQPILTLIHMKIVYFHDPTSIPDYHASFQNYSSIDLLPISWFMCQSRAHFHEQFQAVFLGWLS